MILFLSCLQFVAVFFDVFKQLPVAATFDELATRLQEELSKLPITDQKAAAEREEWRKDLVRDHFLYLKTKQQVGGARTSCSECGQALKRGERWK